MKLIKKKPVVVVNEDEELPVLKKAKASPVKPIAFEDIDDPDAIVPSLASVAKAVRHEFEEEDEGVAVSATPLSDLDSDKPYEIWTQPTRQFGSLYVPIMGWKAKSLGEDLSDFGAVARFPSSRLPRGAMLVAVPAKWGTKYIQVIEHTGSFNEDRPAPKVVSRPKVKLKFGAYKKLPPAKSVKKEPKKLLKFKSRKGKS